MRRFIINVNGKSYDVAVEEVAADANVSVCLLYTSGICGNKRRQAPFCFFSYNQKKNNNLAGNECINMRKYNKRGIAF